MVLINDNSRSSMVGGGIVLFESSPHTHTNMLRINLEDLRPPFPFPFSFSFSWLLLHPPPLLRFSFAIQTAAEGIAPSFDSDAMLS